MGLSQKCQGRDSCVKEEASARGEHNVDVGFPILLCEDGQSTKVMRCICELKKGYTAAELRKSCWKYFEKMSEPLTDDVIVFFASNPFLEIEPQKKASEKS